MKGRVFFDTNIFLYAHDNNNPGKRGIARDLILNEFKTGNCAVSTQVLAEFFQIYVGKLKMPYINAVKELHFMSRCSVIEQTISLIVSGAALYSQHSLSFWDSMILAAAIKASAEILYTEDMNSGQEIEGVKIINPFLK